jgi:hypothetical protein
MKDLIHDEKFQLKLVGFFLILALVLRLIYPGDASFLHDEPQYLELGLKFKNQLDPTIWGLKGKMGAHYGPYTSWFFGLLFFITENLISMVFLKSLIVSIMTFGAAYWLTILIPGARPLFILPILGSLFFQMDARQLWDLNIPNSIMAFTAYVAVLRQERFRYLLLSVVFMAFATLTHLMCLPLIFALALHFLLFKFRWIQNNKTKFALLLATLFCLTAPYYIYLFEFLQQSHPPSEAQFDSRAFLYALMVGRLFTTHDFSYFLGKNWQWFEIFPQALNYFVSGLAGITWLAYPVTWLGMGLAAKRLLLVRSWQQFKSMDDKNQILLISSLTVLFHLIFSFMAELRGHPHYYNGVWPVGLVMLWLGLEQLSLHRYFSRFYLAYALTLFLFLGRFIGSVHSNQGSRSLHYGPTLANQYEIAREIVKIKNPGAIEAVAFHPKNLPLALNYLVQHLPRPTEAEVYEIQSAQIIYADDNPSNGKIVLKINR